uniref:5-beta-cholestane-3-alpha,7-alpha-diol 12-alpha-hydroxylase-like n=1 Tax=Salarias fasciatus TaxID=181472 RepID=A0A672GL30_SALFA
IFLVLRGLYLLGAFRQQRPGEPPLDKGPIPWLGHVLECRRNTHKFLERMRKKHGDVFTIQLGGFYFTFLQDPLSFGVFAQESREKLDYVKFAKQMVRQVFSFSDISDDLKSLQVASTKHLKGEGLKVLNEAISSNLQNVMLHKLGSDSDRMSWNEDSLIMYSYNVVFRAGYLTLFGNEPPSEGGEEEAKAKDRVESQDLFFEFRKYNRLVPDLARGTSSLSQRWEAERLKAHFWKALSVQKMKTKENISRWVWDLKQAKEENGMEESMIDRYMFVLLWASQTNTGPTSFWVLLFLMKHPDAMAAVKQEVDDVLRQSGQSVQPGGPLVDLTSEMLLKTPILDSIVMETLRLTVALFYFRDVKEDMTVNMADGRQYSIRKGDRISVFPYSALHIDPEIHPDPQSFKYNRFLNPDGTRKTDFYKGGTKLKFATMPWGAGVSMCPGRFFAVNELKQFAFLMLVYFEFELKNPDEEIPQIDHGRLGAGAMQPTRDVPFRYRFRY